MSAVMCLPPWEDDGAAERRFLSSLPRRLRNVNARAPLTREGLPQRADCAEDPELSAAAQRVWDAERGSAAALAERYRALAELVTCEVGEVTEESDLDTVRASIGLRVTHGVARWELRSAHRAVHQMPRTLDLLTGGSFPSWRFQRMLRESEDLSAESRRLLDIAVARWSTDIPADRFITLLRALVDLLSRREEELEPAPPLPREVTLAPDSTGGVGSMTSRGPIPEILAYWKRLDESVRAVQAAQRKALRDGTEIPYDVDQLVTTSGRPLPLGRLRYELQLNAEFDTEGVQVPAQRFRLQVTVPALTLLGAADAPGMLEGTTPIPPEMARELAGREDTWFRVLTDPCSGAFLPLPADRYQPTAAMREHLRLRTATCAVPGCTRPVSWAAECDHIEEFVHAHPEQGGRTELENLHMLCWQHHQDKTAGLLDPTRLPTGPREPGRTRWRIGHEGDQIVATDDIDLAGRIAVEQLESAWRIYERRQVSEGELTPDPPRSTPAPPPPIPLRPQVPPGRWDPDDPPPF